MKLRVADDFAAIRSRMDELRRERERAMFANDELLNRPVAPGRLFARERTLALERQLQLLLRGSSRPR